MSANGAPHPLLARVRAGDILVGDGAMGTQLFDRGLASGECPESWNLSRPKVLQEIARAYFDAGSDIVETNTFGASPLKLARYALDTRTEEINRAAVEAARGAVGSRAFVAACLGPSGRMLKPYGDADPAEISASYERQTAVLADAGVDAFCVETMTDLREAALAVRAARAVAPGRPVMATMTFDPTPRGFFTIMGTDVATAARGLAEAGADIVGSNCGNGIENMVAIAGEFRRHTDLPLLIQSNAGLPELEGDRVVYRETPSLMAERARDLIALGVSIIGGCCGTTPEHIRALRAVVDGARRAG